MQNARRPDTLYLLHEGGGHMREREVEFGY